MVQKSGGHQLRLVVYPIIYKVLYLSGGDRRISEPSTVAWQTLSAEPLPAFVGFFIVDVTYQPFSSARVSSSAGNGESFGLCT